MPAIEMPSPLLVSARKFDYSPKQDITPVTGGFLQVVDRSSPLWFAEYTSGRMAETEYDAFQAFLDELNGAEGTFLAYDPRRPRPKAYMTQIGNTTPWGAAPQVTGASQANGTLTLGSMTNGSVVSYGDYISFKVGNAWYLHRCIEGKVSTTSVTVKVRPRPLITTGFPVAARVVKACAEMRVIQRQPSQLSVEGGDQLVFSAVQHINRAS